MLEYWVWFEESSQLKRKEKLAMLYIHRNPQAIFKAMHGKSEARNVLSKEINRARLICEDCLKKGIHIVTMQDGRYKPCRHFVVYVKGEFLQGKSVAVLGTRNNSLEGVWNTNDICELLVKEKYVLHGGLAEGIERLARNQVHSLGGNAHVFLSSGIGAVDHSRQNETLISPFPGERAFPTYGFQKRNALLIDWTEAFVLMESSEISGAYKIAKQALKKSKEVYAVQSAYDSMSFRGNHLLLKEGASPIESSIKRHFQSLTEDQRAVVNLILSGPISMDRLIKRFRNVNDLRANLLELESRGLIAFKGDGLWY